VSFGARRRPERPAPEPGEITAIKSQQGDAERVSIFLDGRFAFGLPAIEAAGRGLRVGQSLSEEEIQELLAVDEAAKATQAALSFVAHRPRSVREVADRLRQRGFSSQASERAIQRLQEWEYLDDQAFAEFWVANRAEHRPRGSRLLAQELRRKGIDREVADAVLAELPNSELPDAVKLAHAKLPSLRNLDPATRRQRLAAYLGRRGYGWDVIAPVLREVLDEQDDGESDNHAFIDR
jgi:regulatory protein